MMTFRKIKCTGKKVELVWSTIEHGAETEHTIESAEEPKPELPKALNAFVPHVMLILGLGDNSTFRNDLEVTGVSIDVGEDERRGMVLTCRKTLEHTNAPMTFNLPHIREPKEDAEVKDGPGCWLVGMDKALAKVESAAEHFVAGARSQTTMELQSA